MVSEKVDEAGGAGDIAKEAASGLLPGSAATAAAERAACRASEKAGGCRCSSPSTWPSRWRPRTTSGRSSRTGPSSCTGSRASRRRTTARFRSPRRSGARPRSSRPRSRRSGPRSASSGGCRQGITHSGVVTFHELAPRLTRIEFTLDVDPGSLIEKAARGMRHVKRAVRADLHRYKAFIEMQELETGAWRGVIEDGELVEAHDASTTRSATTPTSTTSRLRPRRTRDEDADDEGDERRGRRGRGPPARPHGPLQEGRRRAVRAPRSRRASSRSRSRRAAATATAARGRSAVEAAVEVGRKSKTSGSSRTAARATAGLARKRSSSCSQVGEPELTAMAGMLQGAVMKRVGGDKPSPITPPLPRSSQVRRPRS